MFNLKFAGNHHVEGKEPKKQEQAEAKMKPAMREKVEAKEQKMMKGSKKGC